MIFTILERIKLMSILPTEGNYVTFKILIDLKSKVSFSEAEYKDFGMNESEGMVVWDAKKAKDKEIEIGEKAKEIIVSALKKLDEQGKINGQNVSLYEKFMT